MLRNAWRVFSLWHNILKDLLIWCTIDMLNLGPPHHWLRSQFYVLSHNQLQLRPLDQHHMTKLVRTWHACGGMPLCQGGQCFTLPSSRAWQRSFLEWCCCRSHVIGVSLHNHLLPIKWTRWIKHHSLHNAFKIAPIFVDIFLFCFKQFPSFHIWFLRFKLNLKRLVQGARYI